MKLLQIKAVLWKAVCDATEKGDTVELRFRGKKVKVREMGTAPTRRREVLASVSMDWDHEATKVVITAFEASGKPVQIHMTAWGFPRERFMAACVAAIHMSLWPNIYTYERGK